MDERTIAPILLLACGEKKGVGGREGGDRSHKGIIVRNVALRTAPLLGAALRLLRLVVDLQQHCVEGAGNRRAVPEQPLARDKHRPPSIQ